MMTMLDEHSNEPRAGVVELAESGPEFCDAAAAKQKDAGNRASFDEQGGLVGSLSNLSGGRDNCLCLDCIGMPPKASWFQGSVDIVCAVIGTGVLCLSQAFAQLNLTSSIPGLIGAICLTVAFTMNWYSSKLMSSLHFSEPTAKHPEGRRLKTFLEISEQVIGKKWTRVVSPFQIVTCLSTAIAYMIASGQNIQAVYLSYGENQPIPMLWFTSGAMMIQLVLTLFPSLESFKWVSAFGALTSVLYSSTAIVLSVIMYGDVDSVSYEHLGDTPADEMWAFFFGISTICFLFGVQAVQPDIQANLAPKPDPRSQYMKAFNWSYAVTVPLYFLAAFSGYLTFGRDVSSNVLVSISTNSESSAITAIISAAQIAVAAHVLIAYQIWSMPLYVIMEEWTAPLISESKRCTWLHRVPIRFSYVLATWMIAIAFPFFGAFIGLAGALTIVPICFIAPCVFYLLHKGPSKVKLLEKTWMGFIIVVNSIIMVLGAIASVRQIVLDVQYFKMFS